jgi:hypothetical protein
MREFKICFPQHVRRRLAAQYRKLAKGQRFTEGERETFRRMAEAWEATLRRIERETL